MSVRLQEVAWKPICPDLLFGIDQGFQRYWSPKIKELLAEMASAQEEREAAMSGILGSLICRFSEGREKWDVVLQGIAGRLAAYYCRRSGD